LPPEEARSHFALGKDSRDWKIHYAQNDLKKNGPKKNDIVSILYRPFDFRFTYYTGKTKGYLCMPRHNVMRHMLSGENLGIITSRGVEVDRCYDQAFCTRNLIQLHTLSIKEVNSLFPLYCYDNNEFIGFKNAIPNLNSKYISLLKLIAGIEYIKNGKGDLKNDFGPEDIFSYIYALLYSLNFRTRYASFLQSDFPRIPLAVNSSIFCKLIRLGHKLVDLHLMNSSLNMIAISSFHGQGEKKISKIRYDFVKKRIYINSNQYFDGIGLEIWNFRIGGYQVAKKWLSDRKKDLLKNDDINHYNNLIVSLSQTIRIQTEIDQAIEQHGGWSNAFVTSNKGETT